MTTEKKDEKKVGIAAPARRRGPQIIPIEKCKVLPWGKDSCIVELPGGAAVHCHMPPDVAAALDSDSDD